MTTNHALILVLATMMILWDAAWASGDEPRPLSVVSGKAAQGKRVRREGACSCSPWPRTGETCRIQAKYTAGKSSVRVKIVCIPLPEGKREYTYCNVRGRWQDPWPKDVTQVISVECHVCGARP